MDIKLLTIIIPVYNEQKTISQLLEKIVALKLIQNISKEIIVVNDCSTDDSKKIIEEFISIHKAEKILFINQSVNAVKGAAIHSGIEKTTGDYMIIQDADLELNPEDINLLIEPVLKDEANVIYGSRFMNSTHKKTSFWWHIVGNKFLSTTTSLLTKFNFSDMMTCYKLIPMEFLKQIKLHETRFGFEPEVTVKLSKIKEVGISYEARTREEGKKINWKDGFKVLRCLVKYRFSR